MAIRFKHDAAAIIPPSNSSTRKYGQSLVMQQQQQKYQSQQAGYDRMFDAYRQQTANQFQRERDLNQQAFMAGRDKDQRDFIAARDQTQFDQQQKLIDQQRQAKFMDDARRMSSGMIMDDIQNGAYDPATSRKLQQNLVAESEALGNPHLDATQRAEILDKIRAERSALMANRMEKPPAPTAQDLHDQSVVYQDGIAGQTDKNGMFVPLPQQTKRPTSAEDAFKSDPKLADKYFKDAKDIVTGGGETPYDEDARKKAMDMAKKLYEQDNNLGTPTPAPEMPGQSQAPTTPDATQSILDPSISGQPQTPEDSRKAAMHAEMLARGYQLITPSDGGRPYYYHPGNNPTPAPEMPGQSQAPTTPDATQSILDPSISGQPQTPEDSRKAAMHAEMLARGYQLITPSDGGRPYYYHPGNNPTPTPELLGQSPETPSQEQSAQTQSNWPPPASQENVSPSSTPITADEFNSGNPAKSSPAPDFSALASSAQTNQSRGIIKNLQSIYQQQSPDVQQAIAVYLDKNSTDADFQRAEQHLRSKGIDVLKLAPPPPKGNWDSMIDTQRSLSGVR